MTTAAAVVPPELSAELCAATLPRLVDMLRGASGDVVDAVVWDVFRVISFDRPHPQHADEALALVCARCGSPRDVQLAIGSALTDVTVPLEAKLLVLRHSPVALLRVVPPERRARFTASLTCIVLQLLQQQQSAVATTEEGSDGDGGVALLNVDDLERARPAVARGVVAAVTAFLRTLCNGLASDIQADESLAMLAICTALLAELGRQPDTDADAQTLTKTVIVRCMLMCCKAYLSPCR